MTDAPLTGDDREREQKPHRDTVKREPNGDTRKQTLRNVFGIPQLIVLGALGAAGPFGTDFYLASMPDVARDFGTSASAVQATLSSFMIGLSVGQLIIGPLSDRVGRMRLLIGGLVVLVISSVLCALAPSVFWLIVWRLVQGLGGAAALVLSRAVVADLVTGSTAARVFSVLGMITGVAPIVSPIVGGIITEFADWRVVFWVLAALNAAMLVATLFFVRETLPSENRTRGGIGHTLATAFGMLRNRQFLGYSATVWFGFGAMFAYISASPFVYQDVLGFSPTLYTVMFAINACGISLGAALSAWLANSVGPRRLILIGVVVMIAASVFLAVCVAMDAVSVFTIVPALFLIPSSQGLVFGNGTALAVEPMQHARGTALALLGALQFAMAAIIAPIVGIAGPLSLGPLAAITVVCSIIALGAALLGNSARTPR